MAATSPCRPQPHDTPMVQVASRSPTPRLAALLGRGEGWLLSPGRSALIGLALWLALLPLVRERWAMAGLAVVAFWLLCQTVRVEAPLLERVPFPPLTVLVLGMVMRWGLGPLLMAFSGSGNDPFLAVWVEHGPAIQLLWLTLTASIVLVAQLQRERIARVAASLPPAPLAEWFRQRGSTRRRLGWIALLLGVYMAFYVALSLLSGAFDRDFATYVGWVHTLWRLDTPVAALSRLRDLWLLLVPLTLLVFRGPGRWFSAALLLVFIGVALLSGSRGLLFYPLLLLVGGLWLLPVSPRLLRQLILIAAALMVALSPLIFVARDSARFQGTNALDPVARLGAVAATLRNPEPLLAKARWVGRDLYACHDPYLFTATHRAAAPVGGAGLNHLLWLWVPRHLKPDRPEIFDGPRIAKELQGVPRGTWADVWFPCISLPADLWRRWGLAGLAAGSLVVALVVNGLTALWCRCLSLPGSGVQLLLLFYPSTYLQSFPFGTVQETAWSLLWELPKYLLTLWLIGALVDRLAACAKAPT
ncbi:MAG: hypothetical protein VKP70_01535 [Cyanobacteriota bacterium]|nr:hypothetical protein [Cyanobacteriota bacterium]